jgi:predicted secreted protein
MNRRTNHFGAWLSVGQGRARPPMLCALTILVATLSWAGGAWADALPAQNMVHLSATATQELTQDLISVVLQANRDGTQAAEVQAALKQALDAALTEARKSAQSPAMDVHTGMFSVQPRYNGSARIVGWTGSYESALTSEAIAHFKTRATQIASDFGFKGYTLAEVTVSSTDPGFESRGYQPLTMRAQAASVADAPLPVEPGKGVLTVSVNGQVKLTP